MSEFIIRPAHAGDCSTLVEFNQRLALETEGRGLDTALLTSGVQAVLSDSLKGRYFVADSGTELLGQVMHTREWSDWRNGMLWWLQSVYVRPEHRRRGVFRRLVEHVRQLARNDPDVVGLRLYVEHGNQPAQEVYRRLGLTPAGYVVLEQTWDSGAQEPGHSEA